MASMPADRAMPETAVSSIARKKGRVGEKAIKVFCLFCAAISIVTTAGILAILVRESFFFFKIVSPAEFYLGKTWAPTFRPAQYGILPLVTGTLLITFGSAIIALPLGLFTAIYLNEYAKPKLRRLVKPALEVLAGIPTVVYGYFALFKITPLLRSLFPSVEVFNAASGCIVVGIMILPLVASLCEDALHAVPKSLREGAYALGATKLEVTMKIVVPAALSGIMAAFILALSRAIGETMAVSLAAGQTPNLTFNPASSIETMTTSIVQISQGDTPAGSPAYLTIFSVGVTLFIITMTLNIISFRLVRKFRQVYA